jgi:hypothetical protein
MSKYVYTYESVDEREIEINDEQVIEDWEDLGEEEREHYADFQTFREEAIELAIRSQMVKNHGRSARRWRINSITEVEEG